MINDKNLTQESGDNSNNYQAHAITIVNGLTYSDAKDIALNVYKDNFVQLSKDAAQLAADRATKITEDFLKELQKEKEEAIQAMKNPSMQMALFNAQKSYASTGDDDLEQVLVDLLVDRALEEVRTLKQITLDESIQVASKLTFEQMDALSLNFLLSQTTQQNMNSREMMKNYINERIIPLTEKIAFESSTYEHLEYVGCGSIMEASQIYSIEKLFKIQYAGLFSKGGTEDDYKELLNSGNSAHKILMRCLNNNNLIQISAINEEVINRLAIEHSISPDLVAKAKTLFNEHAMSESEIKSDILAMCPKIDKLFELWDKTKISKFTLTTVGIAIARANLKKRVNMDLDLGVWVR
ncbi:hypothetical protein Cthiooxydans_41190 [Comamonas thiooxydans]|uniref:LPO_1073/Vpar_1526 family protein n=1 Tax=Comamonas thiooxydans TaxID=363952 RepID=UPI001E470649|nr:LPO_1073/Vpar_1526 family protein [Comamonas thiooxydans]BDB71707.1 hypothetical protein Cthiooxydans_41190 [Comamonas thiooxydans]